MDEKRREFVLKSLIELAEDRLGKRLPPGERDYLRQMMARAWSEGRSDMALAQSATLNDVMTKLDDIKTRVVSIEERQEEAAKEEAKLDERLQVVDPDLGQLRQFPQRQPLRLAGTSELFGHR